MNFTHCTCASQMQQTEHGLPPGKWFSLKWAFEPDEDQGLSQKRQKSDDVVAKHQLIDVLDSEGRSVSRSRKVMISMS